jgi:hypothetical protein
MHASTIALVCVGAIGTLIWPWCIFPMAAAEAPPLETPFPEWDKDAGDGLSCTVVQDGRSGDHVPFFRWSGNQASVCTEPARDRGGNIFCELSLYLHMYYRMHSCTSNRKTLSECVANAIKLSYPQVFMLVAMHTQWLMSRDGRFHLLGYRKVSMQEDMRCVKRGQFS